MTHKDKWRKEATMNEASSLMLPLETLKNSIYSPQPKQNPSKQISKAVGYQINKQNPLGFYTDNEHPGEEIRG